MLIAHISRDCEPEDVPDDNEEEGDAEHLATLRISLKQPDQPHDARDARAKNAREPFARRQVGTLFATASATIVVPVAISISIAVSIPVAIPVPVAISIVPIAVPTTSSHAVAVAVTVPVISIFWKIGPHDALAFRVGEFALAEWENDKDN